MIPSKPSSFIVTGLILLVVALTLVVGLYLFIQTQLPEVKNSDHTEPTAEESTKAPEMPTEVETEPVVPASESVTSEVVTEDLYPVLDTATPAEAAENFVEEVPEIDPIPLRELPLSESQRSLIETAGIDVETYVIEQDSIDCAVDKVSLERFNQIKSGEQPTFLEGLSLASCI
ncbi:MAG: hypothetical protein AAGA35_01480 [Patescibacteria group bacterium]